MNVQIKYKWFMFWAVDMVLDSETIWTRRKSHIEIYERKFRTLRLFASVWFVEYGSVKHWRFLHELKHLLQARGMTRTQWILHYLKNWKSIEKEADIFANDNLNKRPSEICKYTL